MPVERYLQACGALGGDYGYSLLNDRLLANLKMIEKYFEQMDCETIHRGCVCNCAPIRKCGQLIKMLMDGTSITELPYPVMLLTNLETPKEEIEIDYLVAVGTTSFASICIDNDNNQLYLYWNMNRFYMPHFDKNLLSQLKTGSFEHACNILRSLLVSIATYKYYGRERKNVLQLYCRALRDCNPWDEVYKSDQIDDGVLIGLTDQHPVQFTLSTLRSHERHKCSINHMCCFTLCVTPFMNPTELEYWLTDWWQLYQYEAIRRQDNLLLPLSYELIIGQYDKDESATPRVMRHDCRSTYDYIKRRKLIGYECQ